MSKNALVTINTCNYELNNPEFASTIKTILEAEKLENNQLGL